MNKSDTVEEKKKEFIKLVVPYVLPYLVNFPKTDVPEILWSWIIKNLSHPSDKLKDILKHNKDDMTGLYDYDGIAQEVIDLVKK